MTDNQILEEKEQENSGHKKRLWWLLIVPLAIILLNLVFTTLPNYFKLKDDYRNDSVSIITYQKWGVVPNQLVIDIWGLEGTASRADVSRSFFHIAEQMQDRDYKWIILSHKGNAKFKVDGDYFKSAGESFSYQNPIYLIRTLPENTYNMDGSPAFGRWTGGILGVANRQLEEHNELHDDWYWNSSK